MVIKRTYLWAVLSAALLLQYPASAQKIAYVATEAIMDKLPDAKNARAKLSELQLGWMRDIQRQEQEISKLKADIESNRLLWSVQEKRDADAKLADLEAKLAAFRAAKFGPQQEYEKQQTELMGPVVEKVAKAIEDEAKAQKFDYVFDKSSRAMSMLYANPANDITWAVLKRLGVEPEAAPPGGPAAHAEGDAKSEQDARKNRGARRDNPAPSLPTDKPIDPNKLPTGTPNGGGGGNP
ncbi:MAG TPA: OmpH family outer membrane protein [Candidatus Kapabacteria bacterium]|nr:OmpH family outer membrane protein [Candidatus Kapabacteria bacterium]